MRLQGFCRIINEQRYVILILIFGIAALNIFQLTEALTSYTINLENAAKFGSFFGGYIGAIFTLTSVIVFYLTLQEQRLSSDKSSFETKYFELIKMHRDNVSELEIDGSSGRKLFVVLIREFRAVLEIVKCVAAVHHKTLSTEELIHVAYYCLIFGTGPNSSRILRESLKKYFSEFFIDALVLQLSKSEVKEKVKTEKGFKYIPFEGHLSRLGHYYRHLYQAVKYVNQQPYDIKKKREYVKILRAQLTTHEQALLLLNSLSPYGRDWWKEELILDYGMIRNIPCNFFDPINEFDILSLKKFPKGYFEFEDHENDISLEE